MKPKLSKAELKERILNAAITEFSQHSFLGASTKAIAERAGINKSQLHYYIEDKETLYADVLARLFRAWERFCSFDQQVDSDPHQILKAYIQMKVEFAFSSPDLSRIFTSEVLSGGQRLGPFWSRAMESARVNIDVINTWVADGKIRQVDGRLLLMNIWGLTQYYADYAVQADLVLEGSLRDVNQQQAIIDELVTFILLGCGLGSHSTLDDA